MKELINEELKRIHLLFKYDPKNTLSENKQEVEEGMRFKAADVADIAQGLGKDLEGARNTLKIAADAAEVTRLVSLDAKNFELGHATFKIKVTADKFVGDVETEEFEGNRVGKIMFVPHEIGFFDFDFRVINLSE